MENEMSIQVLSEQTPIAKKQHTCNACEFINESWGDAYFTISELRLIVSARRNGYKIVKGQRYIKQNNVCDGEFYTFKAIPEMHDICLKYDLYDC